VFELNDAVIAAIIFAMENQYADFMVGAESGEVLMTGDDDLDSGLAALDEGADLLAPPNWTSSDGYALMEAFAAGVADPLARVELRAALDRGRGVFKAFKQALEALPELERRWFAFKETALRRRIAEWYDEARVARGLERLGPEPEDSDDLLDDDYAFRIAGLEAWADCRPLFRRGLEEALASFPEPLVEYEYTAIGREIEEGGAEGLVLIMAEASAGAIAGIAVARRVYVADSSFGKLAYLYVAPEHRRLGLARRMTEAARERLAKDGIGRFVIDMPFVPAGFGASLAGFGYEAFGTRYLRSGD